MITEYLLMDDSNPSINYTGPWALSVVPYEASSNLGNSGSPMFDTLHVLPSLNGAISVNFTGTGVAVFISNFETSPGYISRCFVDGDALSMLPDTVYQVGSNIQLCSILSLPDQDHELLVNVSVPSDGTQSGAGGLTGFFFDYVLIEPSPHIDIRGLDKLMTYNGSPCESPGSVKLSSGDMGASSLWTGPSDGSQIKCTVSFIGMAAMWVGFYDLSMPRQAAQSSYQIDGGTPVLFNTTPESTNGELTHQILFRTPSLPLGTHTIRITSDGENTTTPLTLQQVVVRAADVPQSATTIIGANSVLSGPSPSLSKASLPTSAHRANTGLIAGGSGAGAVVFLLAVSVICMFVIRRRWFEACHRRPRPEGLNADPDPFHDTRSAHTPTKTTISPQKSRASHLSSPFEQDLADPPMTKWTRQTAERSRNRIQSPPRRSLSEGEGEGETAPAAGVIPASEVILETIEGQQDSTLPTRAFSVSSGELGTPALAHHVYEEDSGIRIVRQASNDVVVSVFPPAYTEV